MATKRSAPYVHPSRQDQVPDEPRRKRHKPNNAGPKSFKKAHPVNELKSQIRSLKRLLERNDGLPPNVRIEKERALRSAQHELEETQRARERSEMIGRYHKIRFFDRQKATKRLKRARKELQAHEGEDGARTKLSRAVEDAEVDVNYAQYYPLDQPYVSLFPRKGPEEALDHDGNDVEGEKLDFERKGDQEMWQRVKQCMADGTLDVLRNGYSTYENRGSLDMMPMKLVRKEKPERRGSVAGDGDKTRTERQGTQTHAQHESDDESVGDFFER